MNDEELRALAQVFAPHLTVVGGSLDFGTLMMFARQVETTTRQRAHKAVQDAAVRIADLNRAEAS